MLTSSDKKALRDGFKFVVFNAAGQRKCYCTSKNEAIREAGRGGKYRSLRAAAYVANPSSGVKQRARGTRIYNEMSESSQARQARRLAEAAEERKRVKHFTKARMFRAASGAKEVHERWIKGARIARKSNPFDPKQLAEIERLAKQGGGTFKRKNPADCIYQVVSDDEWSYGHVFGTFDTRGKANAFAKRKAKSMGRKMKVIEVRKNPSKRKGIKRFDYLSAEGNATGLASWQLDFISKATAKKAKRLGVGEKMTVDVPGLNAVIVRKNPARGRPPKRFEYKDSVTGEQMTLGAADYA